MQEVFIGVDVAKDWLDVHHPLRGARRIANTLAAPRSFASCCTKQGDWVMFEASGGYDRVLRDALEAAQVRSSVVSIELPAVHDARVVITHACDCQTALNIDPGSASNFDPLNGYGGTPLISPAKRVGVAQPG